MYGICKCIRFKTFSVTRARVQILHAHHIIHIIRVKCFKDSHEYIMDFSIGICLCLIDPMDSIGSPFYPNIHIIPWIPSDRLSTSISNISVNSQSVSKKNMHFSIGIYSNLIEPMYSIGPTFYPNNHIIWVKFLSLTRTAHKHFHWNLLSTPISNMTGILLSLSRIAQGLFHWNLFVSNGTDGLHWIDIPPQWVTFF